MTRMGDILVVDNTDLSRAEALIESEVAGFAVYRERESTRIFTHTVVAPEFAGRGVGSALARGALDLARAEGKGVVPLCPFIKGWIEKNPDYADLVVPY